ncbi:MAG: hypothetical protein ACTHJ7_11360 [Candidatus Nitrosocosmicus sp.]
MTKWGSPGIGDGQFINPFFIAIDSSNNVYIDDRGNDRVQKFDSNGNFLTKWSYNDSDNSKFKDFFGFAVDPKGNLYRVDFGNSRIEVFAPSSLLHNNDKNIKPSLQSSHAGISDQF